jgi:hypothetical protein
MAEVSSPGLDQSAVTAIVNSLMPQPASATPPGVADNGTAGLGATYARGDHTHASKARKQRVTSVNAATFVWTYPTPFAAGVVPICNGIAEDPANSASDCYNVQVAGTPTNTQVSFRIIRQSSGLLGLLLGALSINPTPGSINLHCLALEP